MAKKLSITKVKIGLVFTRSVSLSTWVDKGLFDREKKIYEELLNRKAINSVTWFTYGRTDLKLRAKLLMEGRLNRNIKVVCAPKWLPNGRIWDYLYSFMIPFYHYNELIKVDVIKTNQLDGAWSSIISKLITKKPLIVRCGYIPSKMEYAAHKIGLFKYTILKFIEKVAFSAADRIVVASEHDADYCAGLDSSYKEKLTIIRNYIDTDIFKRALNKNVYEKRIVFVGRLSAQKNLFNLISAVKRIEFGVDIVGSGPLADELKAFASQMDADVRFLGQVDNDVMPKILRNYSVLCLPSLAEGMPKSLLEGMACGLVCIGTKVDGTREVINDGKNGFLAKSISSADISEAILLATNPKNSFVGQNAQDTVINKFSLKSALDLELQVIHGI